MIAVLLLKPKETVELNNKQYKKEVTYAGYIGKNGLTVWDGENGEEVRNDRMGMGRGLSAYDLFDVVYEGAVRDKEQLRKFLTENSKTDEK